MAVVKIKIKLLGDNAIIIYNENPDNSCYFAKVQSDYALSIIYYVENSRRFSI
jgi:hypothetical protein